jgi:hypothetical protein
MSTGPGNIPTRDAPYVTPATLEEASRPGRATYPAPPHGWTCFHCGENFTTVGAAGDHFGATPDATPGCMLRVQLGDERGWQMAFRKLEAERDAKERDRQEASNDADRLSIRLSAWQTLFAGKSDAREAFNHYDSMEGRALAAEEQLKVITAERDRLAKLINTPVIEDFLKALPLEAAHQQERWKADHDAGKTPEDWYWLIGYLAGKAVRHREMASVVAEIVHKIPLDHLSADLRAHLAEQLQHHQNKSVHHIITTAAACLNWHRHVTGDATGMRPGVEQAVESDS